MKNQRYIYFCFDLFQDIQFQFWFHACRIQSVAGSDCNCKSIYAGSFYEFYCIIRICVDDLSCSTFQIIWVCRTDGSQFCFYRYVNRMSCFYYFLSACDVFFKWKRCSIKHNRCETTLDCFDDGSKVAAVIQMDTNRYFRFQSALSDSSYHVRTFKCQFIWMNFNDYR